ncbi:MAG: tripartite tricarboxylate transporter TctB family protein [Desulfovibrio sp.]|jgi:hypothetical protein|nr:tripartite tricarboxylate transporter TctB family protein [Desulfovibrio sp.]
MRKYTDAFFAFFFLIFCGLGLLLARELPKTPLAHAELGLDFFPKLCIIATAGLSLLLLFRNIALARRNEVETPKPPDKRALWSMCRMTALMALYAYVYEPLGFYAGICLFAAAGLLIIGERQVLAVILFPVLLTAAVHLLFNFMGVVLPEGEILRLFLPD